MSLSASSGASGSGSKVETLMRSSISVTTAGSGYLHGFELVDGRLPGGR